VCRVYDVVDSSHSTHSKFNEYSLSQLVCQVYNLVDSTYSKFNKYSLSQLVRQVYNVVDLTHSKFNKYTLYQLVCQVYDVVDSTKNLAPANRVVILDVRRLTGGHNGQAGGHACPLHRAQTGHIGHIL
jgi:hypothetical protein